MVSFKNVYFSIGFLAIFIDDDIPYFHKFQNLHSYTCDKHVLYFKVNKYVNDVV